MVTGLGLLPQKSQSLIFRNKRGERCTADFDWNWNKVVFSQWRDTGPYVIQNACGRMHRPPIVSSDHDSNVTLTWSPGSIGLFPRKALSSRSIPDTKDCHSSSPTYRTSDEHVRAHISAILSTHALVTVFGTITTCSSHCYAFLLSTDNDFVASVAFYIVRTGYIVLRKTSFAEIHRV